MMDGGAVWTSEEGLKNGTMLRNIASRYWGRCSGGSHGKFYEMHCHHQHMNRISLMAPAGDVATFGYIYYLTSKQLITTLKLCSRSSAMLVSGCKVPRNARLKNAFFYGLRTFTGFRTKCSKNWRLASQFCCISRSSYCDMTPESQNSKIRVRQRLAKQVPPATNT
jgi:hypothetical protein